MSLNKITTIQPNCEAASTTQSSFKGSILNEKFKTNVNLAFNGIASATNLLTTMNGNFPLIESMQEKMETLSSFTAKCAAAVQGLLNTLIAFEKKNIIALAGGLLELPIAFFINGYNLFLGRGISAGLNHFDSIISRTRKVKDGKTITDNNGNPQYYDDFKQEGWIEGFKTICKHIPILAKELSQKPFERQGLFPRSFFLCSSFMILGPLLSLLGLYKTGASVRHVFGGLAGIALSTDMKTNTNIKQSTTNNNTKPKGLSYYAMAGIVWVLAAIPDVFKHFDFFSNKVNNATELALCLDRIGGLLFISGNQRKGEK